MQTWECPSCETPNWPEFKKCKKCGKFRKSGGENTDGGKGKLGGKSKAPSDLQPEQAKRVRIRSQSRRRNARNGAKAEERTPVLPPAKVLLAEGMPEETADRDRISEFIEAKEAMAKYWQAVPGEQVAMQRVSMLESQVRGLKARISRMKPLEKQVEDLESKVERQAAALEKQEELCKKRWRSGSPCEKISHSFEESCSSCANRCPSRGAELQ